MSGFEIYCSNCGKKIPYNGNVCPYCKADKSSDKKKINIKFGIGGIIAILIFVYFFNKPKDSEQHINNPIETNNHLDEYSNSGSGYSASKPNTYSYTEDVVTPPNNPKIYSPNNKKSTIDENSIMSDFPGRWFLSTDGDDGIEITKMLIKHNISGCGYFSYKKSNDRGYYLVACSNDCEFWNYYLVYTNSEDVLGPYSNDIGPEFPPKCD